MLKRLGQTLYRGARRAPLATPSPPPRRRPRQAPIQGTSVVTRQASTVSLVDLIQRQDTIGDDDRDESEYLHVSTLIRHCPRMLFLLSQDQLRRVRRVTGRDRIMWAIGKAVEGHLRNSLIAQLGRDRIRGWWSCTCGATDTAWEFSDSTACLHCFSKAEKYSEFPFTSDTYGLIGRPDLLYFNDEGKLVTLETKSEKIASFKTRTSPDPEHVLQTACYVRLLAESEEGRSVSLADHSKIVYGAKDYPPPGMSPYKEFTVNIAQPWLVQEVDRLFAVARQLKAFRAALTRARQLRVPALPPRLPSCVSPESTTAASCPACASCFNRPA